MLRWAGGKKRILNHIIENTPTNVSTYYEPFAGSLTVALAMREHSKPERLVVNDANKALIDMWIDVRDRPQGLVDALDTILSNGPDYYALRDEFNSSSPSLRRSALFIYMNRTNFNGLYRVNGSGKYNVPKGTTNPDWDNMKQSILDVSASIQDFEFHSLGFTDFFDAFEDSMTPDDLVYIDPPYWNGFTGYTEGGFDHDMQRELHRRSSQCRARVLSSNDNCDEVKALYEGWEHIELYKSRSISCDGGGRGAMKCELLMVKP